MVRGQATLCQSSETAGSSAMVQFLASMPFGKLDLLPIAPENRQNRDGHLETIAAIFAVISPSGLLQTIPARRSGSPAHFSSLRPGPTQKFQMDYGKRN